ncbi:hypothetical protein ACFW16_19840 [Inquilinus sp. NPDC058860]|uniref:hypothetical protein n=1 Tax=Inquilinus sp. NPDC058860 TaxID=3346652 RepID=UPI00369F1AEB
MLPVPASQDWHIPDPRHGKHFSSERVKTTITVPRQGLRRDLDATNPAMAGRNNPQTHAFSGHPTNSVNLQRGRCRCGHRRAEMTEHPTGHVSRPGAYATTATQSVSTVVRQKGLVYPSGIVTTRGGSIFSHNAIVSNGRTTRFGINLNGFPQPDVVPDGNKDTVLTGNRLEGGFRCEIRHAEHAHDNSYGSHLDQDTGLIY